MLPLSSHELLITEGRRFEAASAGAEEKATAGPKVIRQSMLKNCTPWNFTFMVIVPISEFALQINCSINFFVYCAINKRFKEVAIGYVRKIFGLKRKSNISASMSRKETIGLNSEQHKVTNETQETQETKIPLIKLS